MKKLFSVGGYDKNGKEYLKTFVGVDEENEERDCKWLLKCLKLHLKFMKQDKEIPNAESEKHE